MELQQVQVLTQVTLLTEGGINMKILFSPQFRGHERIKYTFTEGVVEAELNGKKDMFDFTDFPEGQLVMRDEEGNSLIETELDFQPIRGARKENGILWVKLVNFVGANPTNSEAFPEWIEHEEYVSPVEEGDEANGKDEVEE